MPQRNKDPWQDPVFLAIVAIIVAAAIVIWALQQVANWFISQPTWAQVIEVLGGISIVTLALYWRFKRH